VPSPLPADSLLRYIPFERPVPGRRVVLAWRKSFPRRAAIDVIRAAVRECSLAGTTRLDLGQFMI
jgi:LysR family hydrogen peroxide-inducible transcriptional activator